MVLNKEFDASLKIDNFSHLFVYRVSQCSPCNPGAHYVGRASFELKEIHLPLIFLLLRTKSQATRALYVQY